MRAAGMRPNPLQYERHTALAGTFIAGAYRIELEQARSDATARALGLGNPRKAPSGVLPPSETSGTGLTSRCGWLNLRTLPSGRGVVAYKTPPLNRPHWNKIRRPLIPSNVFYKPIKRNNNVVDL